MIVVVWMALIMSAKMFVSFLEDRVKTKYIYLIK